MDEYEKILKFLKRNENEIKRIMEAERVFGESRSVVKQLEENREAIKQFEENRESLEQFIELQKDPFFKDAIEKLLNNPNQIYEIQSQVKNIFDSFGVNNTLELSTKLNEISLDLNNLENLKRSIPIDFDKVANELNKNHYLINHNIIKNFLIHKDLEDDINFGGKQYSAKNFNDELEKLSDELKEDNKSFKLGDYWDKSNKYLKERPILAIILSAAIGLASNNVNFSTDLICYSPAKYKLTEYNETKMGVIKGENVNVRADNDINSDVIGDISKKYVEIIEVEEQWTLIKYKLDDAIIKGWVSNKYLYTM